VNGVVEENWDFRPTRAPWGYRKARWRARFRLRKRFPRFLPLKPAFPSSRWTILFIYLPDGQLKAAHRFTMERLRALDRTLMIVCAAPRPEDVPPEILATAAAVFWKGLDGFDFSAYAIGLNAIADGSPHADVLVLNDSVLGPFGDLQSLLDRAPWDLTGFTASPQFENHIQSYAFLFRDLTPQRLQRLREIFSMTFCYDEITTVVACMETCFARVASRSMTVGAFWRGADDGTDPTVEHGLQLLSQGYPFVKRSLLGKHRDRVDEALVRKTLLDLGYPTGG
jgi:hypothetical protein